MGTFYSERIFDSTKSGILFGHGLPKGPVLLIGNDFQNEGFDHCQCKPLRGRTKQGHWTFFGHYLIDHHTTRW